LDETHVAEVARMNATPLLGTLEQPRIATRKQSATRVALAGSLTGFCSPGGGEVQLRSLAIWLSELGIDARPWRPWEDDWNAFDVLHLVGSTPEWVELAVAARRAGKRVIISPVTWFTLRDLWREPWPLARRAWAGAKYAARSAYPRLPCWRRRLYDAAELLLPNSQLEAEQLRRLFGIADDKLRVVPNGADVRFAAADPALFQRTTGWRDFVLCVGRIEPRKNQLGLLRALRGTGLPIVVLGDVVPGHEDYLRACQQVATDDVLFLRRVDHDSHLLASAYAACRCLALVSWYETPGLAALEAALTGVPLVLTADGACQEYFRDHARYVTPEDGVAIRAAVWDAFHAQRSPELAAHVRKYFTGDAVARATKEAYEALL
jgi:glycosyltransferase involved in cell wall biosynthesis